MFNSIPLIKSRRAEADILQDSKLKDFKDTVFSHSFIIPSMAMTPN